MHLSSFRAPVAFFYNGRGDHILAVPALRALATGFPGRLTLVCETGAYDLYYSDITFKVVIEVPFETVESAEPRFDAWKVARAIDHCDLFISLATWHGPSISELIARLNPVARIGLWSGIDVKAPGQHYLDKLFSVPRRIWPRIKLSVYDHPPTFPTWAQRQSQRMLDDLPPNARLVAVHNETRASKRWAETRLRDVLADFLENNPDFHVLIVSSLPGITVDELWRERVVSCGRLPLAVAYCLVSKSHLFLGVDSCMLHVADLFRVRGVGLFGPTSSATWGFRFSQCRHIDAKDGFMGSITVDAVSKALDAVLRDS